MTGKGQHIAVNPDRAFVHAYGTLSSFQRLRTACGRLAGEAHYKVAPTEFGVLKTPPAPWCSDCHAAIRLAKGEE